MIVMIHLFTEVRQLHQGHTVQLKGQRRRGGGMYLLRYRAAPLCCARLACVCEDEIRPHLVSVPVLHQPLHLLSFFSFFLFLCFFVSLFLPSFLSFVVSLIINLYQKLDRSCTDTVKLQVNNNQNQ